MLVRSTGSIHLLSTWDEGIPEDIAHENLFGLTWNPMNTIEVLRRIEGTAGGAPGGHRRHVTDLRPAAAGRLPAAELVDGEVAMRAARRIKTAEELAVLREAVAVAETSLAEGGRRAAAGGNREELAGVLLEAAAGGVTTPAVQDAAWVTSREHPWRRAGGDGRAAAGDLVAFTAGSRRARLHRRGRPDLCRVGDVRGAGELLARAATGCGTRLLAACRPGAPASDLLDGLHRRGRAAAADAGRPRARPRFRPAGGDRRSCRGPRARSASRRAWCSPSPATCGKHGTGAVFRRDAVLVTGDGPKLLTSDPGVPSADADATSRSLLAR